MDRIKIIYDNLNYFGQKSGGVSVVCCELQKRALLNNDLDCMFIEYGETENPYRRSLKISQEQIIERSPRFFKLRRLIPSSIDLNEPFVFHSTYFTFCSSRNAINITTCHDFIESKLKQNFGTWSRTKMQLRTVKHSDYVVCISENTKKDLLELLPELDENKIRVIYNGVSDVFHVEQQPSYEFPYPQGTYIIYVGSRGRYKNFQLVLEAIAQTNYNLVMVGRGLSTEEKLVIDNLLPKGRYKCMGFVSEELLNTLYNGAIALTYPSSYEGFGLPILEAQRAGCPVIAYNSTSIPEVIGNTPLLMNELTVKEILDKIEISTLKDYRGRIVDNGVKNAARFSWDKMADDYFNLYAEALASRI